MRRTLFHMMRFDPSYIENSSIASPSSARSSRVGRSGPGSKAASTSARCGAAKAPPKRVHFSAAAAEANRSASRSSCFSVMASAKAPWNTSPAPSVSTVWTGKAGVSCSSPALVEPDRACGPRVPARNDGVSLAIFFSASASSAIPAVSCSGSLEKIRCEDAVSRPSRSDIARSTSTMTGMPRLRASAQRSVQNSRAAAFGQDGVAIVQQRLDVGQLNLPQFRIAERDDGALAARVDHDAGDRRHQARHVHDVLGLDAFMRQLVENDTGSRFRGRRPSARRSRRGRQAARCRSRR